MPGDELTALADVLIWAGGLLFGLVMVLDAIAIIAIVRERRAAAKGGEDAQ